MTVSTNLAGGAPLSRPAPPARRRRAEHEVGELLANALEADDTRRRRLDATESQCQATIVDAARRTGWRVLAIRPALNRRGHYSTPIQGDAGYPDLTLLNPRAGRLLHVELKRHPNKVTADQQAWGDAFIDAGFSWRAVWVPDELDAFCQELADIGQGVAR